MDYDTIFYNAAIHPLSQDSKDLVFSAMAVKDGKITKLFESNPANPQLSAKKTIDLGGKAVIPGFIDSHFHFMASAVLSKIALNVCEVIPGDNRVEPHNLEGFAAKLKEFAGSVEKSMPIICFNYIIPAFEEDRLPYSKEIEEWVPDRFIIVISMDGHSSAHSNKSLKYLGFDAGYNNGILSGEDHEFVMGKMSDIVLKAMTPKLLLDSAVALINEAASNGITMIHCMDGFDDMKYDISLRFLAKFARIIPYPLRIFPQILDPNRIWGIIRHQSYRRIGGCGAWEQDGSVGSQTAAFNLSYKNDPDNYGKLYYSQEKMNFYVKRAHDLGFQISSHAIGPRAIERILEAYENLSEGGKSLGNAPPAGLRMAADKTFKEIDAINPRRHRIDHFEFPTRDQVERAIEKWHLLVTAQPGYSWMDERFQKAYRKYLREEQFNSQIPLRTITEMGGLICASSDSPVQHLNPFWQLQGLVDFPIQNEKLDMYDALRAYTINGAYAVFEEGIRGTLEVGKQADFIVLDKDPFKIPVSDVIGLRVEKTFISGIEFKKIRLTGISFLYRLLFGKKNRY